MIWCLRVIVWKDFSMRMYLLVGAKTQDFICNKILQFTHPKNLLHSASKTYNKHLPSPQKGFPVYR